MARKLFEKQGIRRRNGQLASRVTFVVYTDVGGTALADISETSGGSAIAGSTVTTADIAGLGPSAFRFYGPPSGQDTLYLRCPADASLGVQEIEADEDERLDALEASVGGTADARLDVIEEAPLNLKDDRVGGVVDGTTDDSAAFTAAWALLGASGGTLVVPGVAAVADTVQVPNKVIVKGVGRDRSKIKAIAASFSSGEYVVRLGTGASLVFGCRLEDLTVDCDGFANSRGVYSSDVNEQSGLRNVVVTNFKLYGVHFENTGGGTNPSIIVLDTLELYPHTAGATYGMFMDEVAGSNSIRNVTTGVNGTLTSGIHLLDSDFNLEAIHVETSTYGVEFNASGGTVNGVSGHSSQNSLVRIRSNARAVALFGLRANGATNLVVDEFNSLTIPAGINAQEHLPMYVGAESYLGAGTVQWRGTMLALGAAFANLFELGRTGDAVRRFAVDTDGEISFGDGTNARDVLLFRANANKLRTLDMFIADLGLGVGNSAAATTPGTVVKKIEVFDSSGASLGFLPVYNAIT